MIRDGGRIFEEAGKRPPGHQCRRPILFHDSGGLIMDYFSRRILTLTVWIKYSIEFLLYLPRIVSIKISKRIEQSLQEKILLSTTSVNKCVLCARFASEMAFKEGVSQNEVLSILNMDLKESNKCKDDEMIALLYAQNYAENNGNPARDITHRLYEFYGKKKAGDIAVLTKKSHFFNLSGNTYSAFISRLKGKKAQNSNLFFEIFFVIMYSPVIIPSWIYVKLKKNQFGFE